MPMNRSPGIAAFQRGLLALLYVLAVFPLYWMLNSSFKNEAEIFNSSLFPMKPTMNNYSFAFDQMPIFRMMFNSFGVATLMTAFQLATSLLAAYALVRWRFRGRGLIFALLILPNIKSMIASLGIILFLNGWNEYLWPMLITRKMENSPIQIGLKMFVNSDTNMWGSLMAATTVSCIPILIIYILLQRQIVDSFVRYGVK